MAGTNSTGQALWHHSAQRRFETEPQCTIVGKNKEIHGDIVKIVSLNAATVLNPIDFGVFTHGGVSLIAGDTLVHSGTACTPASSPLTSPTIGPFAGSRQGKGFTCTVTATDDADQVTVVTVVDGGTGYVNGETITIPAADLDAVTGFSSAADLVIRINQSTIINQTFATALSLIPTGDTTDANAAVHEIVGPIARAVITNAGSSTHAVAVYHRGPLTQLALVTS